MASLIDQIKALAIRQGTEFKAVRAVIAALPVINDTTASASSLYSGSKVEARLSAVALQVKNDLTNGAGTALDTLKELADALGNDPNFATNILAALGKRVRVDAAQTFTNVELQQGRDNLSVYSKAEIGDVTTDLVAVFNTALQ